MGDILAIPFFAILDLVLDRPLPAVGVLSAAAVTLFLLVG